VRLITGEAPHFTPRWKNTRRILNQTALAREHVVTQTRATRFQKQDGETRRQRDGETE